MELTKMQILEQALREKAPLRLPDILREEIDEFRASEQYAVMAEAEQYYRNRSSVQQKRQTLAKRSNTRMEHPKAMDYTEFDNELLSPEVLGISPERWGSLLKMLVDDGYIEGIPDRNSYCKTGAIP